MTQAQKTVQTLGLTLLVAADRNWAIGSHGGLLFRLPQDMRRFKQLTTGNTVIFGRKTLESFPSGRALPNRVNIVLTSDSSRVAESGALAANSVEDTLEKAAAHGKGEIFIIGGEIVYRQFLHLASKALVTRVDAAAESADAFFPDLDAPDSGWQISEVSDPVDDNGLITRYITYTRKS